MHSTAGFFPDATFESEFERGWQRDLEFVGMPGGGRPLDKSGKEGFAAYANIVRERLAANRFHQPFQLAENPAEQDAWTTWVEYISYCLWWSDTHDSDLKDEHGRMYSALDKLETVLDMDRDILEQDPQFVRQRLIDIFRVKRRVRKHETTIRRQEVRAQWALDQLIQLHPPMEAQAVAGDLQAEGNRKRKSTGDDGHDELPALEPKRGKPTRSAQVSEPRDVSLGKDLRSSNDIQPGHSLPNEAGKQRIRSSLRIKWNGKAEAHGVLADGDVNLSRPKRKRGQPDNMLKPSGEVASPLMKKSSVEKPADKACSSGGRAGGIKLQQTWQEEKAGGKVTKHNLAQSTWASRLRKTMQRQTWTWSR
jgi:hypothetical protein